MDVSRGLFFSSSSASGSSGPPTGPFTGDVLVSLTSSPYIRVYPFDAGTGWGTIYSAPASPPTVVVDSAVFSPDGSSIFLGQRATPYISAYAWTSGTGFGSKYSDPATALPGASTPDLVVSRDSSVLFAVSVSSPYINAYPWNSSTGFGAKYSNPSPIPVVSITDIACSPTGAAICTSRNNTLSSQIQSYAFNSSTGFGAAYSNPSVGGASTGVKWDYAGDVIFAVTSGGSYLYAWPWSDSTGFGAAYSAPTVSPTFSPRTKSFAVAPDASTVLVGKTSAPQFRVWAFDKVSGWGAELSSITIGGNAASANIAVTGDIAFVGCTSTATLRAYNWSSSGVGSNRGDASGSIITPTKIDSLHVGP